MKDLSIYRPQLPSIAVPLPPLEGDNLDHSSLLIAPGAESAEQVIAQYRRDHSPERQEWFRRYYLQRRRDSTKITIRYVWKLEGTTRDDEIVGVIRGEDLAAAKVLIGNQMANRSLSPISWHLCEDRDGEEPIDVGRFDPWSLLSDITPDDLQRLSAHDLIPDVAGYLDCDGMYARRGCPGCKTPVSVNVYAFNLDSAKCAKCGIRPFLSEDIIRSMRRALPSVTGKVDGMTADSTLLHAVEWMAGVGASTDEIHQEDLPSHLTPVSALIALLESSNVQHLMDPSLAEGLIESIGSAAEGSEQMIKTTATTLDAAIRSGEPFTPLHQAAARMMTVALSEMRRNQ